MLPNRLLLPLIITLLCCASAQAQYVWLDDKGSKQFSDLPPPATVPANRILKSPGKPAVTAPATTAAGDAAASKPQKPATTASKNEEFNKRRAEQAEKEKKSADEQQAGTDKAKNCERARAYLQSLESGVRMANVDKNGERSFMDDQQREKELSEVKRVLSGC
ncbi:MAG: DUF4124 domain-containing protein [Burkholderiales bacterium]|nr:DUF4124 domain-containing protein [Burkholderiales bacterium]